MRSLLVASVVSALSALSAPAAADAWAVAQKVVPGGLSVVVGIDVARIKGTVAEPAVRRLIEEPADDLLRDLQRVCGIDAWARLRQVVIALDDRGAGAYFVELAGASAEEAIACVQKSDKVTARRVGNQLLLSENDPDHAQPEPVMSLGWIDGVLVVAMAHGEPLGRRSLQAIPRLLAGRGVAGDAVLIRALRDVDTRAPLWAILGDRKVIFHDDPRDPRGPDEDADADGELLYATGHLTLGSAPRLTVKGRFLRGAAGIAAQLRAQLDRGIDNDLRGVLRSVAVTSTGELLQLSAAPEPAALGDLLGELARAID